MSLDRDTTITWYGHSCVEITTPGGKTILVDPWFGNPRSPKPPEAVDRCDLMIVTHGHFDHFGDCLSIASRTRPAWLAIHELSLWLGRNYAHKDQVVGMNKGGLDMEISHHKAFMPASQVDIRHLADISVLLGEKFPVKILEIRKEKGRMVVSRKACLLEERARMRDTILGTLEDGRKVRCHLYEASTPAEAVGAGGRA